MLKPPINKQDHLAGSDAASITLVEYGDYECPHCAHAYPIIKNIQQKMGNRLRFVFRNFPLQEMHLHAFMAATATEAAAQQESFWPMHDIIFENQERLSNEDLIRYAATLKLNIKSFVEEMNDAGLQAKVEADFESGITSGVNGTPTFFINGNRYDGSWEEKELLEALENG